MSNEIKSNIEERYKKSIFANIGKKMSESNTPAVSDLSGNINMPNKSNDITKGAELNKLSIPKNSVLDSQNVPVLVIQKKLDLTKTAIPSINNITTQPLENTNVPNINNMKKSDLSKSDIIDIVVKPLKTVLNLSSNFGKVFVKPTDSVLKLLETINTAKPVELSKNSNLVNSPIEKTEDFTFTDKLLKLNSQFDDIKNMKNSSVQSYKAPSIIELKSTSVLSQSTKGLNEFSTKPLLLSSTQTILNSTKSSVLEFNSKFDDIIPIKKSSVLEFNSLFDDIHSAKSSSVLKFNSKFDDIIVKKMNPILSSQTFPEISDFKSKSILQLESKDIGNIIVHDIRTIQSIYDKSNVKNSIPSAVNFIPNINATGFTISARVGESLYNTKTIPELKQSSDFKEEAKPLVTAFDLTNTPSLGFSRNTSKYIYGENFVSNAKDKLDNKKYGTLYKTEKLVSDVPTSQTGLVDFFNSKKKEIGAIGFTHKSAASDLGKSDFLALKEGNVVFSNGQILTIEAFNFKARKGVLNEFTKFYPDNIAANTSNSAMSAQRYVDYLVRKTISNITNPQSDFYTPKQPLSNLSQIGGNRAYNYTDYKGYDNPSEVIPNANKYLDALTNSATSIASGMLSSAAYSGLSALNIGNFNLMKTTPLAIGIIGGEIYWKVNSLETAVKNANNPNSVIGFNSSGLTGIVKSGLGVIKALNFNPQNMFKNDIIDYALMAAEMIAGTKYTAAYAFYDASTKKYSSKYSYVGDNAVNWYYDDGNNTSNDSLKYHKKFNTLTNSIDANSKITNANALVLSKNVIKTDGTFSSSDDIDSKYKNSILNRFKNSLIKLSNTDKLLGKEFNNLQSITKGDSWSVLFDNFNLNNAATINKSIGLNHGEYTSSITPSFESTILPSWLGSNEDTKNYSYKERLSISVKGKKKLLKDKGIPDASNDKYQYSDTKNLSELQLVDNSAVSKKTYIELDDDLIDFYFEDLTTLKSQNIIIPFRAIITGYNDSTNADWQTADYIGRPDKFYLYGGFQRTLSLSFDVAINSRNELEPCWRKINYLQGMCYPTSYPSHVSMTAPFMGLTVGSLLQDVTVIMNSISFDFDGNTIWELEKNYQLPTYIKISTNMTVLYDSLPISRAKHFAQNSDWINAKYWDSKSSKNINLSENDDLKPKRKDGAITTTSNT